MEVHTLWRSHDLESGGSIICRTREDAEKYCTGKRSPWEPPFHRHALETARQVVWDDGATYVSAWTEIERYE